MTKNILLCNCGGTQQIEAGALEKAKACRAGRVHSHLCTSELKVAAEAMGAGETLICCRQEQRVFEDLAVELEAAPPGFVDLRDRAGWSEDSADKTPKMAALLAEAVLPVPAAKSLDITSAGLCLILGGEEALQAAEKLRDTLSVTVLLADETELPFSRDYDVIRGRLRSATGSLGNFAVTIDALQQVEPAGRGAFSLTAPRDGGRSECDLILDLSGNSPLFPAHEKRDGYLRADPGDRNAVFDAVFEAANMIGTFEKPLHVRTEPLLCAHSRARQIGCSNCLNVCPTGAIAPNGDHVSVDPLICAGCGACSAVCPSGAIAYDAPPVEVVFRRISTLAASYIEAGGTAPRLLAHDDQYGAEMIRLAARFGRGLPADVIPFEIAAPAGFGHAEMLGALAAGFAEVTLLLAPKAERDVIARETALARAIAGEAAVKLLDAADPDAMSDALYGADVPPSHSAPALPIGTRRQVTRLAARNLNPDAEILSLPEDAPYGAVLVDPDACTLCLSCISLCPSGALGDNPDRPEVRFQEDACLQCGICATVCPENAITLEPRLNLTPRALEQVILHEEEPAACIECGALFGVKSTIDAVMEKLAGKHTMFQNPQAARMIQMCDNCRVNAQYHTANSPFAAGERPRPRTTEDYFTEDPGAKRRDH